MAKRNKGKVEEPQELNRKQQHLHARAQARDRKFLLVGGIAVGLALLVLLIGAVSELAIKPNSSVATLSGEKIVTKDFQKRYKLERSNLENQLINYLNFEQQFGGQGFFQTQINQIQTTLSSPFALGVDVLDTMVEDQIIAQQASEMGVSVSTEEVDEQLREEVAAGQNAVTEPQATSTSEAQIAATSTAAIWTPTPLPTVDPSGTVTETTPPPTPEPAPTLPLLTADSYAEGEKTLTDNLKTISGMSLAEYRGTIQARLLRQKMQEAIGAETVVLTETQVEARHILLQVKEPSSIPDLTTLSITGTQSLSNTLPVLTPGRDITATRALAQEIYQQLQDGADFAQLAQEYSDDTGSAANGGDLGWFARGRMVPEFEDAAFALQVDEISQPVESQFGMHIIQVTGRDEERPKDEATLNQEIAQAFRDWLQEKVAAANVERGNILDKLPADAERRSQEFLSSRSAS